HFRGSLGNPTGTFTYNHVTPASLDKWKEYMTTSLRKRWARNYIHWLGQDRLSAIGYSSHTLLSEIDQVPICNQMLASDVIRWGYGKIFHRLNIPMLRKSLGKHSSTFYY
ncbi:MAG: hypothetical protein Q9M21_05845, partial [Mariprofundaceae bacterium]|nr:hypothetical protein [Mariprofundaceae bacterium]